MGWEGVGVGVAEEGLVALALQRAHGNTWEGEGRERGPREEGSVSR